MARFAPSRLWLFLRRSSPLDRVAIGIVIGYVLLRLAGFNRRLPAFASFLAFLALIALVYLLVRLLQLLRRRMLWRLRNRLIVAYIFMAVVPVVLLLTMVTVGAYLLELQIGAHLLRDDLQDRVNIISADTNAIAAALNREPNLGSPKSIPPGVTFGNDPALSTPGVASVIAAAQTEWPDLRVLLIRGRDLVPSGTNSQFSGLAEYNSQLRLLSLETLAVPGGQATVLVTAPITPELLDRLPSKLGPIQLTLLDPALPDAKNTITFGGVRYILRAQVASRTRAIAPRLGWLDFRIVGAATLEASVVEDLPAQVGERPVLAGFSFRLSEVNRDLLTSVGQIGPVLTESLLVIAAVFLLLEVAALITGIVMTRTITGSVANLYDATLHVRSGDFTHRVRVGQRDQLGALGESFNEMTASISELIEEQHQKRKLEHEVAIAREVQEQLFPKKFPSVPGLDLGAICRPARVVSGDYYDFIPLSGGRVALVLADISGKGIFAALLMASVQAALHSIALLDGGGDTADVVSLLNRHLFRSTSEDRYATLFYGVYDTLTRTLSYTNAGHLGPLLVTDGRVQRLEDGGTVVGLFDSAEYKQSTVQVAPGSVLLGFSDGLTECTNVYGEELGVERVQAELLRKRDLPAQRIAHALIDMAGVWTGGPEQADDITVVVARMG
jgi:phosphoserine phosphatase RsbU/P